MGFTVDYWSMQNVLMAANNMVDVWNEGISSIMENAAVIEESGNISGNKADRVKDYLKTAYGCAAGSFAVLLEMYCQNFLLYVDSYYHNVDGAADAHIEENELSTRNTKLQSERSCFRGFALEAETSVAGIFDLVPLTAPDFGAVDTLIGNACSSLDLLDAAVNSVEDAHVSADFAVIDTLISRLTSYLQELQGKNESFKTDFTDSSFLSVGSVAALLETAQTAYNQVSSRRDDAASATENVKKAFEENQKALEAQAELDARKQRAEWVKLGAGIVIGLVTSVAVATAGPIGVVVIGTVSGAVSAMIDSAVDEYEENGWDFSQWDAGRIAYKSSLGAVKGLVGSLTPPGAGPCVKAGIKAASSALGGVADTCYDQIGTYGKITDAGEVVETALLKGTSAFVGNIVAGTVSKNTKESILKYKEVKDLVEHVVGGAEHFKAVLCVEAASNLSSGAVKRFTSTAMGETGGVIISVKDGNSAIDAYNEHKIISESVKSVLDIKSMISDVASAVNSAITDDPLRENLKKLDRRTDDYYQYGDAPDLSGVKNGWKDWDSEEYDRMMQALANMEEGSKITGSQELIITANQFKYLRERAVEEAWTQERKLVLQGKGTRDWSVSQQEELIRTGHVSGFDGSHMLDASSNPSVANNPDNIQFLTYEEHIYGAHGSNTKNPTTGRFDPATGKTEEINKGQIPHREKVAFELTDKFDYRQLDVADQLGEKFGFGRGKK